MIEIVISQTANGFLVRKSDYAKPTSSPYGETYIATDYKEVMKIVSKLLEGKKDQSSGTL